jgi:hypothetical protein
MKWFTVIYVAIISTAYLADAYLQQRYIDLLIFFPAFAVLCHCVAAARRAGERAEG